ncbi:MAG: hypothetical protein ACODAG_08120 [Myxococcota bacterium]
MNPRRPRHPKPDLEQLLRDAEERGWRITKKGKYYKALCPCPAKCMETVHLSPSDPKYATNKRNKMSKCEHWKEGS